jgi:hypothetical protein
MLTASEYRRLKRLVTKKPSRDAVARAERYRQLYNPSRPAHLNKGLSAETLELNFRFTGWDLFKALSSLGLEVVEFDPTLQLDGGTLDGYTNGRKIGVNFNAREPDLTLLHEIAHCVDWSQRSRRRDDPLDEFVADGTACLVLDRLGVKTPLYWNAVHVRLHRLFQPQATDAEYERISMATEVILSAGT